MPAGALEAAALVVASVPEGAALLLAKLVDSETLVETAGTLELAFTEVTGLALADEAMTVLTDEAVTILEAALDSVGETMAVALPLKALVGETVVKVSLKVEGTAVALPLKVPVGEMLMKVLLKVEGTAVALPLKVEV